MEDIICKKDLFRFYWNNDSKSRLNDVTIQAESGHRSGNQARRCPDTGESDPKGATKLRCVLIKGESGHKRSRTAKMCPDTSGIGTRKEQNS